MGDGHALTVEMEDPDDADSALIHEFMHPASCAWSVLFHPQQVDTSGLVLFEAWTERRHECDITHEVEHWGHEGFPQEPGWYWVRAWHEVIPSGPWGPEECDGGIDWHPVRRPRIEAQPVEATA